MLSSYTITEGFHGINQTKNGNLIDLSKNTHEVTSFENFIFVGPQTHVCTPYYKRANKEIKNHHSNINYQYSKQFDFIKPNATFLISEKGYKELDLLWLDSKKLAFNKMLDSGLEWTIQPSILPEKSGHKGSLISISIEVDNLYALCALTSSIIFDFFIKVTKKANVSSGLIESFPIIDLNASYAKAAIKLVKELNSLPNSIKKSYITFSNPKINNLISEKNFNISNSFIMRRQALLEIDVLVVLSFNLDLNDLLSIYLTYFPTTQQYDLDTWYDMNGEIVFTNNSQGLKGIGVDRPIWEQIRNPQAGKTYEYTIEKRELYKGKVVTYYAPFEKRDRVEDYKVAWGYFEGIFKEKSYE